MSLVPLLISTILISTIIWNLRCELQASIRILDIHELILTPASRYLSDIYKLGLANHNPTSRYL